MEITKRKTTIKLTKKEQEPCEDTINRQAALKCFEYPNTRKSDFIAAIKRLPSARPTFEGMTNGEVIMALFPKVSITEIGGGSTIVVANHFKFNATWWNSPYRNEVEK